MNKRKQPWRKLRPEIRAFAGFIAILLLVQFLFALFAAVLVATFQDVNAAEAPEEAQTAEPAPEPVPEPEAAPVFYILEHATAPEPARFESVPLDSDLKAHVIDTAEAAGINPALIFAMIDVESDFRANTVGDGGASFGLMQIQERWHRERMERLGCTDLLDPYQNVTVGVDFLSELIAYYDGDVTKAVIAYNMGQAGAKKNCFDRGIYSTKYSEAVFTELADLREV